jgi:hypothetical protein
MQHRFNTFCRRSDEHSLSTIRADCSRNIFYKMKPPVNLKHLANILSVLFSRITNMALKHYTLLIL